MSRAQTWLARLLLLVALLVLLTAAVAYAVLRGSLAQLDGVHRSAVAGGGARVERDGDGLVTIRADSRADLFFAQGFVHAQERYFQMDLSRRVAAGRLSELFGSRALDADRRVRVHGLSLVADEVVAALPPHHRRQLTAYVDGVNEGLSSLRSRPFEYWLLGLKPEAWALRDSVLVQLAMFLDLTDEEALLDGQRARMFETLPADAYEWLTAPGTDWDAPLQGPAVALPQMPAERWFGDDPGAAAIEPGAPEDARGSNSFAVAGALTAHGGATLANDMHLGLRVPNTWFRVRLVEGPDSSPVMQAVGVSLPGTPGVVVGSNRHVAWGFTNSYGDWADRVVLRMSGSPGRYRVPLGGDTLRLREETIKVKDAQAVTLSVPMTRFGPVIAEDVQRRPVAVRWLAHFADAVNLNLLDMLDVTEVDSAVALAHRLGIPPQNILVAGRDGRLAWTIAGRLPRRVGYDPARPQTSDQDAGWRGWLRPAEYPVVVDPSSGRLWTANARVASLTAAPVIGLTDYPLGARASQIRDLLFARDRFDEAGLLSIALDTRGVFLERWRTLMRSVLSTEAVADSATRRDVLTQLSRGRLEATTDSLAYRLVRAFRTRVERDLLGAFLEPVAELPDVQIGRLRQREGPLWQTVSERPAHLLPPGAESWDAYFLEVIDEIAATLQPTAADSRWGERNRARIAHPLSAALPSWLRGWLDMPATPLPGDAWMPRVQGPSFGASQRLVVSPGREAQGILHMPSGQSGHPLSPFYRRGHEDWEKGRPSPLMAGPTRYTLELKPTGED